MASTSQSAVEYVKQARFHLGRELKSLSVLSENLYQQSVLSDAEVSEVQEENDDYSKTTKILDLVIRKGETACYKLLRIIDMTRKRTLGRPPILPDMKSEVPAEAKFDLHYWISCYPFKEDAQMSYQHLQGFRPCHSYQAKLKSKAGKISNEFWMANKYLFDRPNKPDLSYTPLVLDIEGSFSPSKIKKVKSKKSKMSRPKKLRTYVPEEKTEMSPSDLLKIDKNIILVGKAGTGKTALSQEMLKLWAESEMKEPDYMFYFDMRETSHFLRSMSLKDLLFSVFSEPDEGKEEVLDDINKNSDNVTIIFDGITDLSSSVVRRLVEKDLLPDAKIIITCRPDFEENFFSLDFLRVEVKGFSEQSIRSYLSETLGEEQSKVLCNLELLTLCYIPMYAVMVAACFSSQDSPQPCTITEVYINIVRFCLQTNSNKTKDLNSYINSKMKEILSLAEVAFHATERKSVNLTELPCEDSSVHSFLKPLVFQSGPTQRSITYAFLHYTIQEFFAALWLLKNPNKMRDVLKQCLTQEMKHMRHLIPFMCRLLNEKEPSLMKCLIPAEQLENTSNWFFQEVITTFSPCQNEADAEDILFLCQCLYESQCPGACIYLLDKLDYSLDLAGENLDPYSCCAVAYVITQSKERKIKLNLEYVTISEQGMRCIFGCLENVQWCDPLPQELWKIFLLSEGQMDHMKLLSLDGNQIQLPVKGQRQLFVKAVKIMQQVPTKVNVCLYWDRQKSACPSLCEFLLEALPRISSLSFRTLHRDPGSQDQEEDQHNCTLGRHKKQLLLDLCLKAALDKGESFHNVVNVLFSLFSVNTDLNDIHLDIYQHVKSEGCLSVIPKLRQLFQAAPAVWSIDLSGRKASILLEVLKLQSEKKQVVLTGFSHEASEVKSILQCLPLISQLSFVPKSSDPSEETRFFESLFCAAAETEFQSREKILKMMSEVCIYKSFPLKMTWCDFVLDLFAYDVVKGQIVLPALQSVFQSVPVWFIDLSEKKVSILLSVLKLQSEKKQLVLTGWSHEESEVSSVLQCLPYISQLSFSPWFTVSDPAEFFGKLFSAAAERQQLRGEMVLEVLSSVCRYKTFPFYDTNMDNDLIRKNQCDFLLELFFHVKEYEAKIALQSVFQSVQVWFIDLSEKKSSILLEVLKLQPEKKQVVLTGWSHEESEATSFLPCLPYISQLSFSPWFTVSDPAELFGKLFSAAAERQQLRGEMVLEVLSSVCRYKTFPFYDTNMDNDLIRKNQCDFLLELFFHVKEYEAKTGQPVLPALQSVFQCVPAAWSIDLSKRMSHIFPGVLKAQTETKRMKLTSWSPGESEGRSFQQFSPYMSQPRFNDNEMKSSEGKTSGDTVKLGSSPVDMMPKVSVDTKLMKSPSTFMPQLQTGSAQVIYSFRCPGPGGFQCASTGLVFVVAQEAELVYRTVQWDERLLQSAGKIAAGPLFDIKCSENAICQLHLPHCETNHSQLSVIHITDDETNILKPLEITGTHVIVNVPHLSFFGLVQSFDFFLRFWNKRKQISSQVLLFLRPPNPKTKRQNLNVFLLPRNIPLEEVSAKQRNSEYIEAPSKCKLFKDQIYTIHCSKAYKIQPQREEFDLDFGPNYHPTFEIRLPTDTEDATITVRDQTNKIVWEREVDLIGSKMGLGQSVSAEDSITAEDILPAEDRLLLVRRPFIYRVSEPVLNQILDKLLECGIVNDDEMQSLRVKIKLEKARDMIDIVRKKGTDASSVLITALYEADSCLSRVLKLR